MHQPRIIIGVFVMMLFTHAFSRIKKEKEKRKIPKLANDSYSSITDSNLCTIEGNAVPFHCFCSDGTATEKATKAKCWIFNGLTQDHNLWTLFSTQPLITELNIMVTPMGHFTFIPTKALQYLKNLILVTILYGTIEEIHTHAFANLTRLSQVTLARNMITTLSRHAFAHLANISIIDLDENRIAELNRNVFFDVPNLQKLFLKHNNISIIQESAFLQLGHLIELEVSANSISVLTKDMFAGLGELKKLGLSYNKIVMLGDLTFAALWVLEELDLESNQIEFISDRAFAGLTHLWRLNLSYNKLKSLRSTSLDGVPAILNLDLRNNNLETLTFDNIKSILRNFYNVSGYLYLDGNQFICDCRLAWVHILRNETKNELIRYALDELMCRLELDDDVLPIPSLSSTTKNINQNNLLNEGNIVNTPISDSKNNSYNSEDVEYDDEGNYQPKPSLQNQVTTLKPRDPTIRYLLQIAYKDLPCFEEPKFPTQPPRDFLDHPVNVEIKANVSPIMFSYNSIAGSVCLIVLLRFLA